MSLIHIALVTGGYSGESVISYKTARTIQQQLDPITYKTYWIDITLEGWFYVDEVGSRWPINKNDFTVSLSNRKIVFDVAFIALHGTPGEDGKLQGYFDMIGIPYTSCSALTSAITFNKRVATAFAGAAGIPVAKSVLLIRGEETDLEKGVASLQLPVFVKPNNGGSSIGMSKVDQTGAALHDAIQKAFKEDAQVLVEEMIQGREFTVGVFKSKGTITVLPITEVSINADMPFFDFEAKYQGKSTETTPAKIPSTWSDQLSSMAKQVYQAFQCSGVVRIDFIYNEKEQRPYMLELNSIPGQSDASIIPQQVRSMGWTLATFYDKLVQDCITNQKK